MRRMIALPLLLGLSACGSSVTVSPDDDAPPIEPAPPEPAEPISSCPSAPLEPPPGSASCDGQVPDGVVDEPGAAAIFDRAVHEAGHIVDELEQLEGGFSDTLDSGYLVGELVRPADASPCAVVRFACWTGGHGGFGPSGLHGVMTLLFHTDAVELTGRLGLMEGGALVGAPYADVTATLQGAEATGQVDGFEQ